MTEPAINLEPDNALLIDMLRQSLAAGGHPHLTVISNSMAPLLQVGDQVVVSSTTADALAPGAIVVLASQNGTLTHRYWFTTTEDGQVWLHTRGDRPSQWDAPHRADSLIGRVTARERQGELLDLTDGRGLRLDGRLQRLAAYDNWLLSQGSKRSSTAVKTVRRVMRRSIRAVADMAVWRAG